jgi:hypothetical protein
MVRDLPFASANIITNVVVVPKNPRCALEVEKVSQKKATLVLPETQAFVKIEVAPQFRYRIQADLVLPIELPGMNSSTIRDYVGFSNNPTIEYCAYGAEI